MKNVAKNNNNNVSVTSTLWNGPSTYNLKKKMKNENDLVNSPEILRWFLSWFSLVGQPPSSASAHTSFLHNSSHPDTQLTEVSPGGNDAAQLKTNGRHT